MKVKSESEVTQSCLTLSDPMDRSPPGSSVHGIFQARVLEWGAIAFSNILHCCYCCYVASVVSDSVWPHRQQPIRLLGPWDSPGNSTGVGCHCLLRISCVALGNLPTLFLHLPYEDNTYLVEHAPRVIRNHTCLKIKHRALHIVEGIFPA